jgi:MOSC domain-containing protein YiiM
MTASPLTCSECGFDGSRWSDDDLERTLAHTDDLIGYVLQGSTSLAPTNAPDGINDDDQVAAAHALMHHLDELAAARRQTDPFEPMTGRLDSIQASSGGVPKLPVGEAVVGPSGIEGDGHDNRRNHGRPWQALCIYSSDLLDELVAEGHPIRAGSAGENLTIAGIDWTRMRGGLTITISSGPTAVRLQTSGPAAPCHKIGDCFVDREWNRIDHAERPGWARWYASVRTGGTIRPGDTVTITA